MELQKWFPILKKIIEHYPTLGICLGHQLIALAYGAKTKKLAYGHRGAKSSCQGNQDWKSKNYGSKSWICGGGRKH